LPLYHLLLCFLFFKDNSSKVLRLELLKA